MVEVVARYSKLFAGQRDLSRALKVLDAPTTNLDKPAGQPRVHKLDRRLYPELIAALVADYPAGMSSVKLMETYGLGKGSVLKLLREAGVTIRRPGPQPQS